MVPLRRSRRRALVALFALIALFVAACGGDDTSGGSSTGGDATSTGATGLDGRPPVRVHVWHDPALAERPEAVYAA